MMCPVCSDRSREVSTLRKPRLDRTDVDNAKCERYKADEAGGKGELKQLQKAGERANGFL